MVIFSTGIRKKLLITIVSFMFILWLPHQTVATTDALDNDKQQVEANMNAAKEALETFYQAITTQNFGVAEKIYSIPPLGHESNVPVLKDLSTPSEYLQSIYPSDRYIVNNFTILSFNKTEEENFFHALIQLKGKEFEDNSDDNLIAYTQDVLVYRDHTGNWKVSIERFIAFQQLVIESKPFEELSDRDLIYRFFFEMDMNNYGAAAYLISSDMSGLHDNSHESKILFLKNYRKEQDEESKNRISSQSFHILNAFGAGENTTIYKVSSIPYQNEIKSAIQYISVINTNGRSYIKDLSVELELVHNKDKSQFDMSKVIIIFGVSGVVITLIYLKFLRIKTNRSYELAQEVLLRNSMIANCQPLDRINITRDIEASIDYLLNSIEENEKTDTVQQVEEVNSVRKVHIEHYSGNESERDVTIPQPQRGSSRKLYIDED